MAQQIYLHKDYDYSFIPILKNASVWAEHFFTSNGYKVKNITAEKLSTLNKKHIVFLRDPKERWMSGVAQWYTNKYHPKKLNFSQDGIYNLDKITLELLSDVVELDGHTTPQVYWLYYINPKDCIFFNISDSMFVTYFENFLKTKLKINYQMYYTKKNSTQGDSLKYHIVDQLKTNLTKSQWNKIMKYYQEDYKFIEQCKFYKFIESL